MSYNRSHISDATIKRFQDGSTDKLVAENVTQGSNGSFRCAIAGAGTCLFGLPKMLQFTFACHFMRQHPKEAAEKGFLEQPGTLINPQKAPSPLGLLVIKTERGFCCRIDPDQPCGYVQEDQVSAPNFVRHFRQAHRALAMQHGFYQPPEPAANRSLLRSNIEIFMAKVTPDNSEPPAKRKLIEENSMDPTDENVWMNAPSDEPSEYCRLCFSVAQPLQQIFTSPEDTASTCAALIAECTGVLLSAQEDHPAAICLECSEKLHDIKSFRMLCETLNRVVCRNRATFRRSQSPEIEAAPSAAEVSLSPPRTMSILEKAVEIEVAPSAAAVSSSPPRTMSILEKAAEHLSFEDYEEEIDAEPAPPQPPPPALVPCDETEIATSVIENLLTENDDPDDVVELSDSDEDVESDTTEVPVQEPDDEEPYIPLQDDWYCCKLCNQIHQTLDVMIDHLNNCHSEIGFFKKPNPPVNHTKQRKRKRKSKKNKEKRAANLVVYQEIIINDRTYYKCNDCDTLVSQKANMARHLRAYHQGNDKKPRIFCRIPECYQNFMDRMGLTRHLKLQHNYDSIEEWTVLGSPSEVL